MDEDELLWMESGGRFFNVAPAKLDAFRAANPQSRRAHRFETEDGRGYNVSDEKLAAFREANPGAVELRRVRGADGKAAWRRPDPAAPEAPEAQPAASAPPPKPAGGIDEHGLLPGEAERMREIMYRQQFLQTSHERGALEAMGELPKHFVSPVAAVVGNAARANRAEAQEARERADEIDGGGIPHKKLQEAVRYKRDPRLYRTLAPEQRAEVDRLAGIAERQRQPTAENRERAEALRREAAAKEARAEGQDQWKALLTPKPSDTTLGKAVDFVGGGAATVAKMAALGPAAGMAAIAAEDAEAAASQMEAAGMDPREAARRGIPVGAVKAAPWLIPGGSASSAVAQAGREGLGAAAKSVAGSLLGRQLMPEEARGELSARELALEGLGAGAFGAAMGYYGGRQAEIDARRERIALRRDNLRRRREHIAQAQARDAAVREAERRAEDVARFATEELSPEERRQLHNEAVEEIGRETGNQFQEDENGVSPLVRDRMNQKVEALYVERVERPRAEATRAIEAVRERKAGTRPASKNKFEQFKNDVDDARDALAEFDKAHPDISSDPALQRQRAAMDRMKWDRIDKWDDSKLEVPGRENEAVAEALAESEAAKAAGDAEKAAAAAERAARIPQVSAELTEMFRAMRPHKNDIHKIGESAREKLPGWTYSAREGMKGRERAFDKTIKENDYATGDLKDLSGGTLTFPAETNEVDGYAAGAVAVAQSLPEGATILRVKAPTQAAADAIRRVLPGVKVQAGDSHSYRDTKVNIRYENGAVAEMILISDWMNTAKKEGHHAYEVTRTLAKYAESNERARETWALVDAYMTHLYDQTVVDSPEARSASERLRDSASASLKGLLDEAKNLGFSSADIDTLNNSFPGLQTSKHPLLSSTSTTRPSPSENRYDISEPPSAAAGATTAPAGENLPKTTPSVNHPRAGDAGAVASARARFDNALATLAETRKGSKDVNDAIDKHVAALSDFEKSLRRLSDEELRAMSEVRKDPEKGYSSTAEEWDVHSVLNSIKDEMARRKVISEWSARDSKGEKPVELDGGVSGVITRYRASGENAWSVRTPRNGLTIGGGKTQKAAIDDANRRIADYERRKGAGSARAAFEEAEARPWEEAAVAEAPTPPRAGTPATLAEKAPAAPDVTKVDPSQPADSPIRQELFDALRARPAGAPLTVENQAALEAIAARAEAAGLYRTAAEARQAAGTWTGTPFGAGGAWPMEAPPAVANSFGDLVTLVRQLSDGGLYPAIRRRMLRDTVGAFSTKDGSVALESGLFAAVDELQRRQIRADAEAEAKRTGRPFEDIFRDRLATAMSENLFRGPRQAMSALAHEIGHVLDYMPEGTLARGNVLGHLAGLKKHLASTLYPDPATAKDYGGTPGLDPKQRAQIRALGEKNVSRYPGESDAEFRRRQSDAADRALRNEIARRGLAEKGRVVEEMRDLAKWFRGEDRLDAHFENNPAELFAEAFSAWVNYPKTAAKKAPLFDALFQGWLDARPEAARSIRELQDGVTRREAEAAAHAGPGGTPDLTQSAFFAHKTELDASARWAEQHMGDLQALDTIGKWERTRAEASNWLVGPNEIWEREMFARGGFSNPANLPLFRSLQQRDNTGNAAAIWKYNYDCHVKPLLEGVPQATFLNYLEMSRVAHEVLGPEMEGGRVNLENPGGVTPGAVGREGNAATSAAAWLKALQDHHPEIYAKCEAARKALWEEVRNGRSAGGEGSPMQLVRESRALSQAQKDALTGNEWYVAFRAVLAPDPTRPVSSDAISTWDGIFSQKDGGTTRAVGDVVANTLVQDYTLTQQLRALDARIEAVDWLRANKPEWIGERVAPAWDPATRRLGVPQLQKPGWRVLPLLRDGKAEGWWVPDFVAESLAPNRRGSVWGERAAASYARLQNASLTTQNVRFNIMNTLRDLDGAAFHAMPRSVRGVGVVQGAVNALWNVVGDLPLAARMLTDNTAALLQGGKWDPKVVHALASGALNNTAQGGSAYAANGGGGVYGMAADLREQGLSAIPKDKLRGFLGGMGFDPDRIDAALGREEGVMKKLGATWDWTWGNTAGKLNDWLSRGEIRVKSAALADLERRFPGMPPEQRAWYVRNMMGTPDMGNRPLADRNPYFRIVAPFYTPFVHGVRQQLAGVFRKDLGMRATAAARLATRVAIKALSFVAPALAQTWATDAAEEAERERAAADAARAAGDAAGAAAHDAAAAAARERADRNFALAQRWEAIPTVHKVNGIVLPVGEKLGADSYIYLPSDPSTLGPETLILGMLGASLTPRQFDRRAVAGSALGEFTPNFGTGANTAIGLATGFDVNQGRQIVSDTDAHPELSMAGWIYDNITGRGRGILPSSTIRRWIAGDEPFGSDSRRAASGIPGYETFARTFLRRSGGGLQERRAWLSTGDKRRDAERKRTDEAFAAAILERDAAATPEAQAAAQKRIEDLGAQLAQYGGDPGERVRNLLQRVALRDGQGWTPAQLWALAQRWNISKRDVLRYGDTALRRQLFGDAHADGRGIDLD